MTLADEMKQAEAQAQREGISTGGGNGDWFKFQEGDNIFRILSKPVMFFEKFQTGICYTDCGYQGTAKFLTWIFDLKDGKLKLAKLPYTVGESVAEFETDEDYTFDGFPMPYNIKVKAKNAGTKEVKYTVIASPKRADVEPWVMEELRKKGTPENIIEKMKEKKKAEHMADGTWQREQDRKAKLREEIDGAREAKDAGPKTGIEYPEEQINLDDIPF